MKTFGAFLLVLLGLGLAYGFEDNEFTLGNIQIISGGTRVIIGSGNLQNNGSSSIDKVNVGEIVMNSKFLPTIKIAKDNELKNIPADDFEGDDFFAALVFVKDTLKALRMAQRLIMESDERNFLAKI